MRIKLLIIVSGLLLFSPRTPYAGEPEPEGVLNRLLAPGPLMQGHQELEGSDCLKCHEVGKGVSSEKCMKCHQPIRRDVDAKRGFHGLAKTTCIECHTDHKGRDKDTTEVDEGKFDHTSTGYPLEGKHAELKCTECHTQKRTEKRTRKSDTRYFGAKTSCLECHKKEDIHHFKGKWAKTDCIQCHGLKSWKQNTKFDHKRDGHFALEGKHAEIKCAACHKNGTYEWKNLKQANCLACHADQHKSNLSPKFRGGQCTKCHSQTTWGMTRFDHAVTGYPLEGKHKQLQCTECHKQKPGTDLTKSKNFNWTGLKSDCLSCHKDFHVFGGFKSKKIPNPNACKSCHNEASWKEIHGFNHSVNTRLAIEGKHIGLDCAKCHRPRDKKGPGIYHWDRLSQETCEACHKSPHKNDPSPVFKQKKCDQCHFAEGWNVFNQGKEKFDHDKTRFKLDGSHLQLKCAACHVVGKVQVFKFDHVEQKFCIDCHQNPHRGQFHERFANQSCTECHNTGKFSRRSEFDHSKTAFKLGGAHLKVKCEECHKPTQEMFSTKPQHPKAQFVFPKLAEADCTQCHSDYHNGQLSNKCSTCHSDKAWKSVSFDHSKQSKFPLTGKHLNVKCAACHKPVGEQSVTFAKKQYPVIRYKPISGACTSCHKDPHLGHFGGRCQECHMEKGWKLTKDFHKKFTLSGVHYSLQCQECHRDNRQLAGTSEQCLLCHQKDDIHQGTLPNCGQCHKQQFWEDPDFKHSLTRFPLRGAHRTLDCSSCHARGIYQGTDSQCISCHLADAQKSAVHPQPIPNFTSCTDCHNQFVW